jgi:hypothetical protein
LQQIRLCYFPVYQEAESGPHVSGDPAYTAVTGPDLRKGLEAADERVREAAAERGVTPAVYRKILQQRFRDALSVVQQKNAGEENQHESN